MMLRFSVVAVVLSVLLGASVGEKDDSYYTAGTGNPNTEQTMYWKDGENVLQDLSKFSSLHVVFHQCAWTWMQMEDDGNDVDENDYWYMGKIPPMGANVAYSLYGNLKGKTFTGCGKDTFINSFHTDLGFNVFVDAMYLAGVSAFQSPYKTGLTADCQGYYGVGCDSNAGFAMHKYSSSQCNPQNVTGIKDSLSTLNSAMNNYAKCVKIYDSSKYSGYTEGTSLALLEYSHSCFYQDMFSPDGSCPDPYGKLSNYQTNFHKGITEARKSDPYHVYYYKQIYQNQIKQGKKLMHVGMAFLAVAAVAFLWNENIVGRCMLQRARRKAANNKLSGEDDDQGTEAVHSRTDAEDAVENAVVARATEPRPTSQAQRRREMFIGRTIEVCGNIKQTGTVDTEYIGESAAFVHSEYNDANEAFDRMCTAGGDACVDAAEGADILMFASRSYDCNNDLLEGNESYDDSYFDNPQYKASGTSNDWAQGIGFDENDELLRAAELAEKGAFVHTVAVAGRRKEEMPFSSENTDSSECSVYLESENEEMSKKVEQVVPLAAKSEKEAISKKAKQVVPLAAKSEKEAISKKAKQVVPLVAESEKKTSKKVEQVLLVAAESESDETSKKVEQVVPKESAVVAVSEEVNATMVPVPTREDSWDANAIAKSRIAKILSKIKTATAQADPVSVDRQDSVPSRDLMPSIVDQAFDLEDQCGNIPASKK